MSATFDLLSVAVDGVAYWLSEREPVDSLTIRYFIDRHPCDDEPYLAGIDFVPSDAN